MADDVMDIDGEINEYLNAIGQQNTDEFVRGLGLQKTAKGYRFHFFDKPILFDGEDFIGLSEEDIPASIKTVLYQYLMNPPEQPLKASARRVTFRELSKDSPLFYRFAENTGKTIEQTFSGRMQILEQKCRGVYGTALDNASWDLCIRFKALPRIPVTLQFNDVEGMLPAKAIFLFHEDAVHYLGLRSLGRIVTYLTGLLIK